MAGSIALTIAAGLDVSNEFEMGEEMWRQSVSISFGAPLVLPEVVRIQVAGPAGIWRTLRSGMTIIELAAECTDQAIVLCAEKLRLKSVGSVSEDRVFEVIYNIKPGV